MQKSFVAMTPQKRSLTLFHAQEEHPLTDLSPMLPHYLHSNSRPALALEMLQSPLPANRDLFSQLLATEFKPLVQPTYELMEEETYEDFDEFYHDEQEEQEESELEEDNDDNDDNEEEDSEIKKRKRKSTAQIKVLKQELDREGNWSKEKIAEMSELTGLSQSQVYKWWWDQKKKSIKHEKEAFSRMLNKRKQIKKEINKRTIQSYAEHKLEPLPYQIEDPIQTKPKNVIEIEEAPQTEKKVNKRLVF
jgi:hypothetical protein